MNRLNETNISQLDQINQLLKKEFYQTATERYNTLCQGELPLELEIHSQLFKLAQNISNIDDSIWFFEDMVAAYDTHTLSQSLWERIYGALIQCYTYKRSQNKSKFWEKAATDALGPNAHIYWHMGKHHMAHDHRNHACKYYEDALTLNPEHSDAHLSLAEYYYIIGEFPKCEELLASVFVEAATWRNAQRLKSSLYNATGENHNEQKCLEVLLAESWEGDIGPKDRVNLGLAFAAQEKYDLAHEQFCMVRTRDKDGPYGNYAQSRIEYIESAHEGSQRNQLAAFPTTTQKRNYCGPAVLELCLKYLCFDLGQDEIADVVKREHGTPMHSIMAYLEQHGIAARRIEATPNRLRAAIDLGLPVIVEEEYSDTSHVAVITGYDDHLGVFISNDPATHRQTIKTSRWMESAGTLFGNGGIIVLGHKGPQLKTLESACDDKGLQSAEHFYIMDDCARERTGIGKSQEAEANIAETLRLASKALDLNPEYKLAWYEWASSWVRAWQTDRSEQSEYNAQRAIYKTRTYFPMDEWPHQIQGRWLRAQELYEESFIAFFNAHKCDPSDSHNLFNMGENKLQCGYLTKGEEYLFESLKLDPASVWSGIYLAVIYLKQLRSQSPHEQSDNTDQTLINHPALAFLPQIVEADANENIELTPNELTRRAAHFVSIALESMDSNPWFHSVAAELALLTDELSQAITHFTKAIAAKDESLRTILGLSGCLMITEDYEQAIEVLTNAENRLKDNDGYWATVAYAHSESGNYDAARNSYICGIESCEGERNELTRGLFNLLKRESSGEAAGAQLREIVENRAYDDTLVHSVAWLLDENHQRGHAIALFKMAIELFPSDVGIVFRLGKMLSENISTREQGISYLERAVSLAPEHPAPRIRLALSRLEQEPEFGLELLEPLRDQQDMLVEETRACLLAQLKEMPSSEQAHKTALRYGGDPKETLLKLIGWHIEGTRYDRALTLAERIDFSQYAPGPSKEWAEDQWLTACRMGGRSLDILPQIETMCENGVPAHLAWDIYWAYRSVNYSLAAKAALVHREEIRDYGEEDVAEWTVRGAGLLARTGDRTLFDSISETVNAYPTARAELVYAYDDLNEKESAIKTATSLYEDFPTEKCALEAMEYVHRMIGESDKQLYFARQLLELYPYEHQGPERTSWLLAKLGQVEEALDLSLRAIDAAPYCHLSHTCRAVSLFMADRFEESLIHAKQSELLEPSAQYEQDDDALMIYRALTGDEEGLNECFRQQFESIPKGTYPLFEQKLLEVVKLKSSTGN